MRSVRVGRTLMMVSVPLREEETQDLFLYLLKPIKKRPCEDRARRQISASPICHHLDPGLAASRTVSNKCL